MASPPTSSPTNLKPTSGKSPTNWLHTKPKPSVPVSAALIKHQSTVFLLISGLITTITIIATLFTTFYINQKLKDLSLTQQQVQTTQASTTSLEAAVNFINTSTLPFDLILSIFPDNTIEFAEFVQTVEVLSSPHINGLEWGGFGTISSDTSRRYESLNLRFSSDPANLVEFLNKLEKLPYLLEIISISGERDLNNPQIWRYDIKADLTVGENLK